MNPHDGVTIGIPLYNEEAFIEAAIRSAAGQCEALVVADNRSTDGSAGICQRLAREFPHLTFIQHPANLGAAVNFRFVLEQARTPYFMWLGAHDMIPPGYVQKLKAMLEAHPGAPLAFGAVTHLERDGRERSQYNYPYRDLLANASPATRLMALIRHLSDCSLIHGVFRTEAIRAAWIDDLRYLGCDHVLLSRVVVAGPFVCVPQTSLLRRNVHETASYTLRLERITGVRGGQVRVRRMPQEQFAQAKQIPERLGGGPWYRLAAWYWLTYRYGEFSGGLLGGIEWLVRLLLLPWRGWNRLLRLFRALNGP